MFFFSCFFFQFAAEVSKHKAQHRAQQWLWHLLTKGDGETEFGLSLITSAMSGKLQHSSGIICSQHYDDQYNGSHTRIGLQRCYAKVLFVSIDCEI